MRIRARTLPTIRSCWSMRPMLSALIRPPSRSPLKSARCRNFKPAASSTSKSSRNSRPTISRRVDFPIRQWKKWSPTRCACGSSRRSSPRPLQPPRKGSGRNMGRRIAGARSASFASNSRTSRRRPAFPMRTCRRLTRSARKSTRLRKSASSNTWRSR